MNLLRKVLNQKPIAPPYSGADYWIKIEFELYDDDITVLVPCYYVDMFVPYGETKELLREATEGEVEDYSIWIERTAYTWGEIRLRFGKKYAAALKREAEKQLEKKEYATLDYC